MDPMSTSKEMRICSEEEYIKRIETLEEENKILKFRNFELEKEKTNRILKSSEDPPREMLRTVLSESDLKNSQIPVTIAIYPVQIDGTSDSFMSISSEGVDSRFNEIHVKEEPVVEFFPDSDNLQTKSPAIKIKNEDMDIDIKEEDVGFEQAKSKSDTVNFAQNSVDPLNAEQSSGPIFKRDIDESVQILLRSAGQVSSAEPVSHNVHNATEVGTDEPIPSSSKYFTRNAVRQKLANSQPQVSSPRLSGQKEPYLKTQVRGKTHTCDNCCASFETKYKLMDHKKWHTGEKKLRKNRKTASGEKPSMSLQVDKKSLTVKKVNARGQLKNQQREREPEVCDEVEIAGGSARIDSINLLGAVEGDSLKVNKVLCWVFDFVENIDLLNCRLVCKEWNRLTLPFTRSRLKTTIGMQTFSQQVNWDIESFVKLMENSNALGLLFPFRTFNLSCQESTHEEIVFRFAQLCQLTVPEYILDFRVNQMTLSTLLKSSPNLTSLKIPAKLSDQNIKPIRLFPTQGEKQNLKFLKTLRVGLGDCMKINCPTYLDEIFGVAQSITTLSLETSDRVEDVEVLKSFSKFGKVELIQSLTLTRMTGKLLEILKKMNGLKLKHLDIFTYVDEEDYFDWFELLDLYKDSLITLRVTAMKMSIIFPRMSKLKLLKLFADYESRLRCLGNECFNTTFPSLRKVFLCVPEEPHENLLKDFLTPGVSASAVKSLIFEYNLDGSNNPNITMDVFQQIQSTFNFSTLKMFECVIDEDGDVVKQIWTHLTGLEGLSIYGNLPESEDMDSLITGIPVDAINQMGDLTHCFNQLAEMNEVDRENEILRLTNKYRKLPSIHNIKNLQSLKLSLCGREIKHVDPKYVTDLTGYLGLYSIKSLQHLYVQRSKMSDTCANLLVKNKRLVTWKFHNQFQGIITSKLDRSGEFVFPYAIRESDYK